MKVTWETKDVKAGRVVNVSSGDESMVFYRHVTADNRYGLVSLITGMVLHENKLKRELADILTMEGFLPNELS